MGPRARVNAVVAAAAVLVVGAVVGVTWLQTRGADTTPAARVAKARPGVPPLLFDFGVHNDREARDLARGARLLKQGKRSQAKAVFARYHSLQAELGSAFASWPDLDAVRHIAATHPESAVAQLHLGLALFWS